MHDRLIRALMAGYSRSWVHNAAITDDTEALRRICLEHADWWNNTAWPALEAAGITPEELEDRREYGVDTERELAGQ